MDIPRSLRALCAGIAAAVAVAGSLAAPAFAQPVLTPEQRSQLGLQAGQGINEILRNVVTDVWLDGMNRHLTSGFIIWEDLALNEATSFQPVTANATPPQRMFTLVNVATREATVMTQEQYDRFLADHARALENARGGNRNSLVDDGGGDVEAALLRTRLAQLDLAQAMARDALARNQPAVIVDGRTYQVAELLPIYAGYNPAEHGVSQTLSFPPGPSAAGRTPAIDWYSPSSLGSSLPVDWLSLSAVGNSLPLDWYLPSDFTGPLVSGPAGGVRPPYAWLLSGQAASLDGWQLAALAQANPELARALYGQLWSDRPFNAWDNLRTNGAQYVGNTSGLSNAEYLRLAGSGDLAGLGRLLAQPFNILVTWGSGVYDLDLHMTGPDGAGGRFHIYYADRGSLPAPPFAELIQDCICTNGSEVILTSNLLQGGVYRVSAFNFGNQSTTATELSSGNLVLQVVRGGTAQGQGEGTTIVGGHVLFTTSPQPNQPGNTWTAVEIDPATGRIYSVNHVGNSQGSANVP
jgi:hypothetical protein